MAKKIFLIHGLGGTADKTWGRFPELLESDDDLKDYEIIPLQYQTNVFRWDKCKQGICNLLKIKPIFSLENWRNILNIFKKSPSIINISKAITAEIKHKSDIRNDEIILVGHSLGGIILKKIVLSLNQIDNIKICFFDTPHSGSGLANIGRRLAIRNKHLKELELNNDLLLDLNNQWQNKDLLEEIETLNLTSSNDDIVNATSSESIFYPYSKMVNNTDHLSIVKPETQESLSYQYFKEFLLKKKKLIQYKRRQNGTRSYEEWLEVDPREHLPIFQNDAEREGVFQAVTSELEKNDKTSIRLTGMSGLGKTRLLHEAIKESKVDEENILIYTDDLREREIEDLFREIIEDESEGLLIIENCSVDLHNKLMRDYRRARSNLKLITVDYFHEQVDDSEPIRLEPLDNNVLEKITRDLLPALEDETIRRVAHFCEGNPLMAVLISEQYKDIDEEYILGSVSQESIIKRILEGNKTISEDELAILRACSIFDVFAFDGDNAEEFKYILEEVAQKKDISSSEFIHKFSKRQVINRVGNYARVVPKPIAVTLAAKWWEISLEEDRNRVFESLPESLRESFASQIKYLEQHPNVAQFLDSLYGAEGPLGKAENLLKEQGSWFFRQFTGVNPKATSRALYNVLTNLPINKLIEIDGDIRRNFVWGLEKLVFHQDCFLESGYSLLLLASRENEAFANSATGQFTQLYNATLSGTEATPALRFKLLDKGLALNDKKIDLVILKALKNAIDLENNSRMVGAEYQGIRELNEWKPQTWSEIFIYIEKSLLYIELIIARGDQQKEKGLKIFGESIRSLLRIGFSIDTLDQFIRRIIDKYGIDWLSAIDSISQVIEYELKDIPENRQAFFKEKLDSWLQLLDPHRGELAQQLKMLVSLPNWQHVKAEDNRITEDGRVVLGKYRDLAKEKAVDFAKTIAQSNIYEFIPHLNILLYGEQRQTKVFGETLACQLKDERIEKLIHLSLANIIEQLENHNLDFITGLFVGLFKISVERWDNELDRIYNDVEQVQFYPNFIRTGVIKKEHLSQLLQLIENNIVPPNRAMMLSYGSVMRESKIEDVFNFCLELTNINDDGAWTALSIIYMYLFGRGWDGLTEYADSVKKILLSVSLSDKESSLGRDIYHWEDLIKKILSFKISGNKEFAKCLLLQILKAIEIGVDYSARTHTIKPMLHSIIAQYPDELWPLFINSWAQSSGVSAFNLMQLFDRDRSTFRNEPSIFEVIPEDILIDWCDENPKENVPLVARSISLFEPRKETIPSEERKVEQEIDNPSSFDQEESFTEKYPTNLFIKLLESYGNINEVKRALYGNLSSGVFVGSLIPYLEEEKEIFQKLTEHENTHVNSFANERIQILTEEIENITNEELEETFKNRS